MNNNEFDRTQMERFAIAEFNSPLDREDTLLFIYLLFACRWEGYSEQFSTPDSLMRKTLKIKQSELVSRRNKLISLGLIYYLYDPKSAMKHIYSFSHQPVFISELLK